MKGKFNDETARHDIYARVTDKIVAALEQGVRPWSKPWDAGNTDGRIIRPLRHNGKPYQGINVLMLWGAAMEGGYTSPFWMTFKQAQEFNAHVKKGEHGSPVVYASTVHKVEQDEGGHDVERDIRFLKSYTVFNADQIEGLPEQFYDKPPPRLDPVDRIEHAEEFFRNTGADVRTGGGRAFYSPGDDYIRMPPIEAFRDAESYYATLAHETTHWTKGPGRIERDFGRKRFGDEGYAMEELVAELGASFICADLDLTPEPREENAAYIDHWIKVLKGDKHAIFSAAGHAQKAADFVHKLQPFTGTEPAAPEQSEGGPVMAPPPAPV